MKNQYPANDFAFHKLTWFISFSGYRGWGEGKQGKITILQMGPGESCFALQSMGMST